LARSRKRAHKRKQKNSRARVLVIALLAVVSLGSVLGYLSFFGFHWYRPVEVRMDLTGSGSMQTVATTWQDWSMQMPDGSTNHYRSDIVEVQLFQAISGPDPTPIYGELDNPIQFQLPLPKGYDPLYGSYFDAVNIYDQITVYLNGNVVASAVPAQNYPTNWLTHTAYDDPNQLVIFKWNLLLGGSAPSNQAFTLPPIDLRSQVAASAGQPFELKVAIVQSWTLYEMCTNSRSQPAPCKTLYGPVNEGVVKSATFKNSGGSVSGFTASFPTETFSGATSTDQYGNPVIAITHVIPTTTTTTTCGPGWNCVLGSNGTSERVTVTQTLHPPPLSLCSLLPSWASWLCNSTLNIPNWLLLAIGAILLIMIIAIIVALARRPRRLEGFM
jgi:hypothetical protein